MDIYKELHSRVDGIDCLASVVFATHVEPMYMHEYGHTIDSRNFGVTYLLAIGLPSVISAAGTGDHSTFYTELLANRHAEKYFSKQYNVKWNSWKGREYPLTK